MPQLDVTDLSKSFRIQGERRKVVDGVSFSIAPGEVMALLGPNGAGKSSVVRMILGLLTPDSGEVRVGSLDPHKSAAAQRHIGSVLEGNRQLFGRMTVLENALYFGALKGLSSSRTRSSLPALLKSFQIDRKANELTQKLSRGMQQKLSIVCALLHRPSLLILDEPTLGLDRDSTQMVVEQIRTLAQSGVSVLLTTHQMEVAEQVSTSVAVIMNGRLIVKQSTTDLFDRFSAHEYEITPEPSVPWNAHFYEEIAKRFLCTRAESSLRVRCDPDQLYEVFKLMSPHPISSLRDLRHDLARVIERIIKGNEDGHSIQARNPTSAAIPLAISS